MTTNHIDQLREWWETAEVGDPKDGDVIIEWAGDGHAVRTFLEAERDDLYAACTYRILARAPKPKPAWHDAPAVIASMDYCERQVWQRDTTYENRWYGTAGDGAVTSDLLDVTPLIEAKVTDEMVELAAQSLEDAGWDTSDGNAALTDALSAALGWDTE